MVPGHSPRLLVPGAKSRVLRESNLIGGIGIWGRLKMASREILGVGASRGTRDCALISGHSRTAPVRPTSFLSRISDLKQPHLSCHSSPRTSIRGVAPASLPASERPARRPVLPDSRVRGNDDGRDAHPTGDCFAGLAMTASAPLD